MLDSETKRRIDAARKVLVGRIPDPKSQVEQITIALIYKFMDDMDAEAESLGGERRFFSGKFTRFAWARLTSPEVGGHEAVRIYADALATMPENENVPPLFRDIFKNAYLPYNEPEIFRRFLKIISEFEYDHSERIGDAFEYLLSALSSQGDAGQFRTPRHIIELIVKILDPKKGETILDPACGTAGFLISSYRHILRQNMSENGSSTLTPDESGQLAENLVGYDIAPDMVRLSLVNMYLHGLVQPQIHEYDTLTSVDRWGELATVILANPPFMSPQGGIQSHARFTVQSNQSEVLFLDYILEHLKNDGRAGVIVPEGLLFRNQVGNNQLKKKLAQEYLVAVISLPAGVFKPYSGVKTSILIIDKNLASRSDDIAYFHIENDGYELGDRRRPINKNDIPRVFDDVCSYLSHVRNGEQTWNSFSEAALIVPRHRILADREYRLTGEHYQYPETVHSSTSELMQLGSVATVSAGDATPKGDHYYKNGTVPFIHMADIASWRKSSNRQHIRCQVNEAAVSTLKLRKYPKGTILMAKSGASTFLNHRAILPFESCVSSTIACVECDTSQVIPQYAYRLLQAVDARNLTPDRHYPSLRLSDIRGISIPVPPILEQEKTVEEIESLQAVIDGARLVAESYKVHISFDEVWPRREVGDLAKIKYGFTATASEKGDARFIRITDIGTDGALSDKEVKYVSLDSKSRAYLLSLGDVLVARTGASFGKCMIFEEQYPAVFASYLIRLQFPQEILLPKYFWLFAQSDEYWIQAKRLVTGGGQPQFNGNVLRLIRVPVPPAEVQREIVAEFESEITIVRGNMALVDKLERRISKLIARAFHRGE